MIVVSIVVVCSVVAIILVFMNNQESKKQQAALFYQFSKLGSRYNLSFTSQEMLHQRIIGFDAIHQKMLVFEMQSNTYDWYLINLRDVKTCSLKKIYSNIDADNSERKQLEQYLEVIALEFCFKDGQQTVALPFYIKPQNAIEEIPYLYNKAKDWEVMLGKMLATNIKRA